MSNLYIRHELLRHEPIRLSTYYNWKYTDINPKVLAACGFYYEGVRKDIFCFSCNYKLSDPYIEEEIFEKHKLSLNCDFLNGFDVSISRSTYCILPIGISFVNDIKLLIPKTTENLSYDIYNPTYYMSTTDQRISLPLLSAVKIPEIVDSRLIFNVNDFFSHMKYEYNRLQTFKIGKWTGPIEPLELVKLGFFYTLLNNIIQCAFCRTIICVGFNNIGMVILFHWKGCRNCMSRDLNIKQFKNIKNKPKKDVKVDNSRLLCKICYVNEINALLDCKHLVLCYKCANNEMLKNCPVCRNIIKKIDKIYLS